MHGGGWKWNGHALIAGMLRMLLPAWSPNLVKWCSCASLVEHLATNATRRASCKALSAFRSFVDDLLLATT